jgi:molecular chaperone DnaK (HSP70)
MDWILIQNYCDKFKKTTGLDPFESKRAILRLIDAVEKQRKVLSSNMESPCNVECIMQEYDIHERLTRDEF